MANKNHLKEKPIRLFDQKISLKATYPSSMCEIKGDTLFWYGKIRPSPLSREYCVLIKFKMWKSPSVWILGDELQKLDSPEFPHRYQIDKENQMVEICLYRYREFTTYKFLSKTIVPWTVEWLYFYELWLATGEWYGGGDHPSTDEEKIDLISEERL